MKCKTFKIRLDGDAKEIDEVNFNEFLENLNVKQISSALVGDKYWSVLVFYNDDANKIERLEISEESFAENIRAKPPAGKAPKVEIVSAETIVLTADEDKIYAVLREWRNGKSGRDGLPPYMIAHNDSLMLMAKENPQTHDELVQIKGFGEKRAQKYGDEILEIIAAAKSATSE